MALLPMLLAPQPPWRGRYASPSLGRRTSPSSRLPNFHQRALNRIERERHELGRMCTPIHHERDCSRTDFVLLTDSPLAELTEEWSGLGGRLFALGNALTLACTLKRTLLLDDFALDMRFSSIIDVGAIEKAGYCVMDRKNPSWPANADMFSDTAGQLTGVLLPNPGRLQHSILPPSNRPTPQWPVVTVMCLFFPVALYQSLVAGLFNTVNETTRILPFSMEQMMSTCMPAEDSAAFWKSVQPSSLVAAEVSRILHTDLGCVGGAPGLRHACATTGSAPFVGVHRALYRVNQAVTIVQLLSTSSSSGRMLKAQGMLAARRDHVEGRAGATR
eukprot:gene3118-3953_t